VTRILVVEDGHEYIESLERYLGEHFEFGRAGDGYEALEHLRAMPWQVIFLDMRFDRAQRLMGELAPVADRFNGDLDRARRFLAEHQGTYVLSALREAGFRQAVLFSYDFDGEPRRFRNLQQRYAPLTYLPDSASPGDIRRALHELSEVNSG
jgi:CheY-like chemotaxis protein